MVAFESILATPREGFWGSKSQATRYDVVSTSLSSTVTSLEDPILTRNWLLGGTATVRVSAFEIESLEKLYTFRQRKRVLWFLEKHPFLVPVLLDAYTEVESRFPHSRIFFEVANDPEVEGWIQLIAYIRTFLPVDQALAQLDRLDEEWFLDQLDQVGDFFNFNLEIV